MLDGVGSNVARAALNDSSSEVLSKSLCCDGLFLWGGGMLRICNQYCVCMQQTCADALDELDGSLLVRVCVCV